MALMKSYIGFNLTYLEIAITSIELHHIRQYSVIREQKRREDLMSLDSYLSIIFRGE